MQQLKQLDEISLMELLNINSEDLVDRFQDLIENDPNKFERELQQWFGEEENEDTSLD
jgi:hypothetical protein